MDDTLYGSEAWAREQTFSATQARSIYRQHGLDPAELIADLGRHPRYTGDAVLDALGY